MKKKLLVILAIIGIIGLAVGITAIVNVFSGHRGPVEGKDQSTTTLDRPEDGSTYKDYDSYDNLAILAGIMEDADFTGVTEGEVKAKVGFIPYTQTVDSVRTIIGNKGFQETISQSALVNSAIQKYFIFDERKVLTRDADKIDGKNTTWQEGTPHVYSNEQYLDIYGWLPNQISYYILCKDTILDISDVTKTDDGLNQIVLSLAPKAAAMYQYEVKEYGDLTDFPEFEEINFTVLFDDNWVLKQTISEEVYKIKKIGINTTCTSKITETFSYDDLSLKDEDYFSQYVDLVPNDYVPPVDKELTPSDYLSAAFGPYLNGKNLGLDISLGINDNNINGKLVLDLTNSIYSFTSSDLDLSLTFKDGYVYLSFAEIRVKLNIDEFISLLDLDINISDLTSLIDLNSIMTSLGDAVITKDENMVNMTANLSLLGLNIPLNFNFSEDDGNISLVDLNTSLNIKDIKLDLNVKLVDDVKIKEINPQDYTNFSNAYFLVDDIKDIIANKSFDVDLSLEIDGIGPVEVKGTIFFSDTLKAKGSINLGDWPLVFKYIDDIIYLDMDLGGGFLFPLGWMSLSKTLKTLLPIDIDNLDLNGIINLVLNLDFKSLISNFNLTDGEIDLGLNLEFLGLGNCNIVVKDSEDGFSVSIDDLNLNLVVNTNSEVIDDIVKPDLEEYRGEDGETSFSR